MSMVAPFVVQNPAHSRQSSIQDLELVSGAVFTGESLFE